MIEPGARRLVQLKLRLSARREQTREFVPGSRLKAQGQAILIVDKHLGALVKLADRHAIIEKGQVVWTGTSTELTADASVAQRYLQV
jgi:ABC-type branched-subunit amino acid transport system ATPase component